MKAARDAAMMERTPFAIDNAQYEDESDDGFFDDDEEDDQVLDEVDAFLEAHDSGLSEADKKVANGTSFSPLIVVLDGWLISIPV